MPAKSPYGYPAAQSPVVFKTSNYSAAAGETILCDATGGAFTVTLPVTATPGDFVVATKTDATAALVLVVWIGKSRALPLQNSSERYVFDGVTWRVALSYRNPLGRVGGTATWPFDVAQVVGVGLPASNEGHLWLHNPMNLAIDSTGLQMIAADVVQSIAFVHMNSNDMEVEWKLAGLSGTSSQNDGGVYVRYKDAANYYYLDAFQNSARLIKVVAGSLTVIQSSIASVTTNDILKLRFVGSTWTVFKNGSSSATNTDTGVTTGVYAGLKPPSAIASWRIRNFIATAL